MKKIKIITLSIVLCGFLSSCIQKELPNSEADILTCILPQEILRKNPIIENSSIMVMVHKDTDLKSLSPEFTLTLGAIIEPPSGTKRDFTSPQEYVVTSQDGNWKKSYLVSFTDSELSTIYKFEDTVKRDNGKYYIFAEKDNGKVSMEWASGNIGYSMTLMAQSAKGYPTIQSDNGVIGKCLELVTRSTGGFGALLGMHIAAGNLFIGTFDVKNATTAPLKATKFGLPFTNVPTYLTGYYKYKAGSTYTEKGKVVDKKDMCNIYAVFYETDDNLASLDGTNQFTHENIYSIAKLDSPIESDEWIKFNIPFVVNPNKKIDNYKLRTGKYNVAVVFTSSVEGDKFSGAVGSTLFIDEVELLYNPTI